MTRSPRPLLLAALAAGLAFLPGCENTPLAKATPGFPAPVTAEVSAMPEQPLDPALLQPPETTYRLGPGDTFEIEMLGDPATKTTVTVGPDGRIYYNILPGVDVWGLTLAQARDRIGDGMKQFVRERPIVALTLRTVSSEQVWVLGRLNTPGVYTLGGPTTLLDAVSRAGGLEVNTPAGGAYSEPADLSRSFLVRGGHIVPVDFERLLRGGDLSQNVYLQPDDFILVPSMRSAQVHVLGAVLQPRTERMSGTLTVIQAIALAGGTVPGACLPNVAVLRGSLTQPEIAIVAVDKVLHGKAPDVRLEPGDIVFVPYKPERVLLRYVNLILDTFVRTVGVNEGAYTVNSHAQPLTVGVNLAP
jgi:polysaccharide export outer membrane protein